MKRKYLINPIDQLIEMDLLNKFKSVKLLSGVEKLVEIENDSTTKVIENAKIKINLSIRDKSGKPIFEKYNPNTSVIYNLISDKAKRKLTPKLKECILSCREKDVFWVLLESKDHDKIYEHELYYRIEIYEVNEIKISFPELDYNKQKQMIDEFKSEGNELFMQQKFKEASEVYFKGFNFFLQIPKKKVKKFPESKKKSHYEFGFKITLNYLKSLYKSKNFDEYKEKIVIIERKYELYPNMKLEIFKIKANFYKLLKDENNLEKCIKEITEMETDPKEVEIYQNLLKKKKEVRENIKLNKAFLKSLRMNDIEKKREKKFKNLKNPFEITFVNNKK